MFKFKVSKRTVFPKYKLPLEGTRFINFQGEEYMISEKISGKYNIYHVVEITDTSSPNIIDVSEENIIRHFKKGTWKYIKSNTDV